MDWNPRSCLSQTRTGLLFGYDTLLYSNLKNVHLEWYAYIIKIILSRKLDVGKLISGSKRFIRVQLLLQKAQIWQAADSLFSRHRVWQVIDVDQNVKKTIIAKMVFQAYLHVFSCFSKPKTPLKQTSWMLNVLCPAQMALCLQFCNRCVNKHETKRGKRTTWSFDGSLVTFSLLL